jgi:predicted RecB family endonuclease
VIKILVAMRLPGIDVCRLVETHRRYVVELVQQWTRLKEDEAEYDVTLALVVDAELFRLDSLVHWLDAAAGRLKRASSTPPPQPDPTHPRLRRRLATRR